MKKSEPILPLPIYDDLFDQNRFNSLCDPDCHQQLIYATNELPFFQFVRDKTLNTATQLYIRNICRDKPENYYKYVPDNITNYSENYLDFFNNYPRIGGVYDDGVNPPFGGLEPIAEINCGKLQSVNLSPFWSVVDNAKISIPVPGLANKLYFKLIIDKLFISSGSSFSIKVYSGNELTGVLIATITQSGIYNYTLTADVTNSFITVVFDSYQDNDEFIISHLQAGNVNPLDQNLFLDDVPLDHTKIKITTLQNGKDIITYCENPLDYGPEPGDYYYIVNLNGEIYFSEVFTLKTPKELEKYYCLMWYNSCDVNDSIIYALGTLVCFFYHRLYFNAALFNPEYLTTDDTNENGLGDKISTFKRWQKSIRLDIDKSPLFLSDALSATFFHDNVYLKNPINDKKEYPNAFYKILSITPEIKDILLNCYQSVNLKLILSERFTNKTCCDTIPLFDCSIVQIPTVDNLSEPLTGIYLIEGTGVAGSFAVIEYSLNGGGYVVANNELIDTNGDYAILFDTNGLGAITDLKIRIRSKTITCDFGVSTPVTDLI